MSFVHLHTHSHFSLLDGLQKLEDMVPAAKKMGMPAIGLTDHGNMYGAIEFFKLCKKHEIKPIVGMEAYVANRTRHDKTPGIDNERFHLTLLAKNNEGYKNLIKLTTKSHLEGFYYKPRVDKDLLREHREGVIALSGCLGGEFCKMLWKKDYDGAEKVIREWLDIFGKENFYMEVMHHPSLERFNEIREGIIRMARKFDLPMVGTQDAHYLLSEDARAQDTLIAIQTNTDLTDPDRLTMTEDDFSLISGEQAKTFFADIPEAVDNTLAIAEKVNIDIPLGNWVFPDIKVEGGRTADEELKRWAYDGIAKRGLSESPELKQRIDYELDVIKVKGYAPYFLVVADLLKFAADNGIYTNIRGSVAGSMVTYLTGITKVDPMHFGLPFERFLNPERPSAPDIDMDYADNRRDEMLEYARRKYGADKVAQIGTFGTMMAKGAVRDVARALGHPYALGDKISKLIPMGSQGFPMTITKAFELEPELASMYKNDPQVKEIIDLAKKLEGCVRHISVHAAGVVIAPTALTDFTPLQLDPKGGKIITQFDMYTVEEAGLLKFDFLGIRNLAILSDAVRIVKKTQDKAVDVERIPIDDKPTFEMLAKGETMGLFQLNGGGMTKALVELGPTRIEDLNLMVALYRPGPIDNIAEYIARKTGQKKATYPHPKMRDFLEKTFGVLVYQDDLLMTAIHVAGYSWGEVDKFRKAVGKKIPEEMAKQHVKFVEGCIKVGGMTESAAEELWKLFEPFQGYGFNKAHAASYGFVAYQTAFMKAHYPSEYMTAVLTAEQGDTEEVARIIAECKNMKIPVLPPDINESFRDFTVIKAKDSGDNDKIRFGLLTIKNLGEAIANAIIEERKARGKFSTFSDFLDRVKHKDLNKKSLEALIKSGAVDNFGVDRGVLLANLDDALAYNREGQKNEGTQDSLFALFSEDEKKALPVLRLKEAPEATLMERLAWEKELLGLYISGHPLDRFRDKFEKHDQSISKVREMHEGLPVLVAGIIEEFKPIMTQKGDQMAFLKVADFTGSIEVVVFPKNFADMKAVLIPDACVAIKGRISKRNDTPSVVAEACKAL